MVGMLLSDDSSDITISYKKTTYKTPICHFYTQWGLS
jgi:hypothetical protein